MNGQRKGAYSFLLAAGLFAGLLGVAIDQVTATVSPDYFAIGKGIPKGDHFRLGVAVFGFEAGFTMGIVVGGIYLLANNPKRDRLALSGRQLFGFLLIPIVAALAPRCRWVCFAGKISIRWTYGTS